MQPLATFGDNFPLDQLAQAIITAGAAPIAACAVRYRSADLWLGASGFSDPLGPNKQVSGVKPLFDLASVSKPFFATAVHTAITQGRLSPSAPIAELLPCIQDTWAQMTTVESLLSHRSGLAPHVELFRVMQGHRSRTKNELLRIVANCKQSGAPEANGAYPPVYSDLGYILLGAAIETHFDTPLDDWCLQITSDWWQKDVSSVRQWLARVDMSRRRFVPTEIVPWRGGEVSGVVHDENAWLLSGHGMSGHTGLFATVDAVADFGVALLDAIAGRDGPIQRETAIRATARRPDGTLCAGFDRRSSSGSSAGSFCGDETFGHLGFTGTSVWCDPERSIVVVLLTNRAYPSRENLKLRRLRPQLHDALFRWAYARQN